MTVYAMTPDMLGNPVDQAGIDRFNILLAEETVGLFDKVVVVRRVTGYTLYDRQSVTEDLRAAVDRAWNRFIG